MKLRSFHGKSSVSGTSFLMSRLNYLNLNIIIVNVSNIEHRPMERVSSKKDNWKFVAVEQSFETHVSISLSHNLKQ